MSSGLNAQMSVTFTSSRRLNRLSAYHGPAPDSDIPLAVEEGYTLHGVDLTAIESVEDLQALIKCGALRTSGPILENIVILSSNYLRI